MTPALRSAPVLVLHTAFCVDYPGDVNPGGSWCLCFPPSLAVLCDIVCGVDRIVRCHFVVPSADHYSGCRAPAAIIPHVDVAPSPPCYFITRAWGWVMRAPRGLPGLPHPPAAWCMTGNILDLSLLFPCATHGAPTCMHPFVLQSLFMPAAPNTAKIANRSFQVPKWCTNWCNNCPGRGSLCLSKLTSAACL